MLGGLGSSLIARKKTLSYTYAGFWAIFEMGKPSEHFYLFLFLLDE